MSLFITLVCIITPWTGSRINTINAGGDHLQILLLQHGLEKCEWPDILLLKGMCNNM